VIDIGRLLLQAAEGPFLNIGMMLASRQSSGIRPTYWDGLPVRRRSPIPTTRARRPRPTRYH